MDVTESVRVTRLLKELSGTLMSERGEQMQVVGQYLPYIDDKTSIATVSSAGGTYHSQ
jgi:hypothetical protein